MITLYTYFRSSAAFRVRIALHHKGIPFESQFVHLAKGEQHAASYGDINPAHEIPALRDAEGRVLTQSMAIMLYLDDLVPRNNLFPTEALERAQVISVCEAINSGIHPLQNLKVLKELGTRFGASNKAREEWAAHWIHQGLVALETKLQSSAGTFCFGGTLTAADCFLIPQVFNAKRYGLPLDSYPTLARIYSHCLTLPAFRKAHPASQPDTPPGEYKQIE